MKGKFSFSECFDSIIAAMATGLITYSIMHYGYPGEAPKYLQALKLLGYWVMDLALLIGGGAILLDFIVWLAKITMKKGWNMATSKK